MSLFWKGIRSKKKRNLCENVGNKSYQKINTQVKYRYLKNQRKYSNRVFVLNYFRCLPLSGIYLNNSVMICWYRPSDSHASRWIKGMLTLIFFHLKHCCTVIISHICLLIAARRRWKHFALADSQTLQQHSR